jgi:hypothetical protein
MITRNVTQEELMYEKTEQNKLACWTIQLPNMHLPLYSHVILQLLYFWRELRMLLF